MNPRRLFQLGACGLGVSALCCFTPALVIALAWLGLGTWVAFSDWMLLPVVLVSGVLLVVGYRGMRRAPGASPAAEPGAGAAVPAAEPLVMIAFEGCPNAPRLREVLERSGRAFREVRQDDLPDGHPYRDYTSPSLLEGERVLFGMKSDAAGCSAAPLEPERLLAELRGAATP